MTDFLAGFYGGVALGWLLSQLFSRRRRIYLVRSPRPSNLLELPPLPRRWEESPVQRGNGHGGPTTPKPSIKPTPSGGRLIRLDRNPDWQLMDQPGCAPKPEFPPPRVIREDFLP